MVGKVWYGLKLKDGGGTDDLDRNGHDGFRHWYRIARNSVRSQWERPSSARLGRDRAEIQIPDHDGGHDASSHNAGPSGGPKLRDNANNSERLYPPVVQIFFSRAPARVPFVVRFDPQQGPSSWRAKSMGQRDRLRHHEARTQDED
jgi:hypothetical protein